MSRGRRLQRWAAGLWLTLALAFAVNLFFNPRAKGVWPIFAHASQQWWGEGSIYDRHEELDAYRYSPTFAVALSPIALLPEKVGWTLFNFLSIGLLYVALKVLARELLPGDWPPWREGALLCLALVGTVRGVWSGQTNAAITACVILAVAAVRRGRFWPAALLLAVPVFIKIWPVALFFLLALRWPRQLIGRFTAACAGLGAIPFVTRPGSVVLAEYGRFLEHLIESAPLRWAGNRDAWTILEQLGPVDPSLYRLLQLVTAVVVAGWCLGQARRDLPTGHYLTLVLSIWAGWQLLFGPGTERMTYGLVAPFASWAVLRAWREERLRVLAILAWSMAGILGAGWFERKLAPVFAASTIVLPVGVALFLVWLVLREARD